MEFHTVMYYPTLARILVKMCYLNVPFLFPFLRVQKTAAAAAAALNVTVDIEVRL